jgi:hypothetical protein
MVFVFPLPVFSQYASSRFLFACLDSFIFAWSFSQLLVLLKVLCFCLFSCVSSEQISVVIGCVIGLFVVRDFLLAWNNQYGGAIASVLNALQIQFLDWVCNIFFLCVCSAEFNHHTIDCCCICFCGFGLSVVQQNIDLVDEVWCDDMSFEN